MRDIKPNEETVFSHNRRIGDDLIYLVNRHDFRMTLKEVNSFRPVIYLGVSNVPEYVDNFYYIAFPFTANFADFLHIRSCCRVTEIREYDSLGYKLKLYFLKRITASFAAV